MDYIFYEKQKFKQKWIIAAVLFSSVTMVLVFAFGIYRQIIMGLPFGNSPASNPVLLIVGILVLLIAIAMPYLILQSALEIRINQSGLEFRYFPFFLKFRLIKANTISSFSSNEYRPLRDFGGYGIRYSLKDKNIVYNVYGKMGVEIVLSNGKKIIFGTQKPDELCEALKKITGK